MITDNNKKRHAIKIKKKLHNIPLKNKKKVFINKLNVSKKNQ